MVKLFCAIVGVKGSAFPVQVDESDLVGDLKNAIKANKEKNPIVCDATELQLFLAKKGDVWLPDDAQAAQELEEGKVHEDIQALINGEKMQATWTIDKVLNASNMTGRRTLNNRQIHILVVVPPAKMRVDTVPTRTVPRVLVVQDSSSQWLERYLAAQIPSHSLPLVDTLSSFIQEDLPAKIGMKQDYLQRLMDSPMDVCPTFIDKLFTVENASPCNRFDARIMTQIISPVCGRLSTYSFICFWDLLIQVVLTFVFVDAKIDRYDSAMGLKNPAFVFLLDNVCVFRGEEGGPYTSINVPRDALQDNLMWSYGNVPYMFGYAVVGYYLELYALVHTVHGQDVVLLGRFQLDQWMERIRFLLALLKLCQLFQAIADIYPDSGRGEYRDTKCSNGR